eukprot:2902600-Pyramimonas_sp.AAC.1
MEEEAGAQNRKYLEALMEQMRERDPRDLIQMCHVCRLEKCFDDAKAKIVLAVPDYNLRKLMKSSMEQIGAATTMGQAPAGYLEEELGAYADMLQ